MKNVVSKSSAPLAVLCAIFMIACNVNNTNPALETEPPAPEGVVDKAYDLANNIPTDLQKEFEGQQLYIMTGDGQIYELDSGTYVGEVENTACDGSGICIHDPNAGRYMTELAPLQSQEELTPFLAPGEVAIGNCAPVGGTMCAAPGNYTLNGAPYSGRISCNLVRVDGKAFMRAHVVPCEVGQCEMIGAYPVFGLCTTCKVAADCTDFVAGTITPNLCTTESCTSAGTCQRTNNALACPDGNLCNGAEMCANGSCQLGTSPSCDDFNLCTNDACAPVEGCTHTNNSLTCSDGNVCTVGDVCALGQCQSGSSPDCDDGNVCTADTCAAAEGCKYTVIPGNVPCDDGDACTLETTCSAGACVASTTKSCSDANVCTLDACDSATGACSHPLEPDGKVCPGNSNQCVAGTCVSDLLVCTEPNKLDCSANVVNGQNAHVQCKFAVGATKGTWNVKAVCGPINNSTCAPITGCGTGSPSEADCSDGLDNDSDGSIDCADSNCTGNVACQACANSAACDDGNLCTTDSCVSGFCSRVAVICSGGAACVPATGCPTQPCTPSCTGKQCGSNGCGGVCGTCASGFSCDATGQCQNAPATDQFRAVWLKPSNGVPSSVATFVIATECKKGNAVPIPFHYLFNDPASVKYPASATSLTFTQVVSDLLGSTCKGNIFGYDAGGSIVWYAVMDSGLTKSGTWSYQYNSVNVTNTGVGTNNQGGGDFVFYPGTATTGDDDGDGKPNATDPDDTDASK